MTNRRLGCVFQHAALSGLINRIPEIVCKVLNWCGHCWGRELMLRNRPATWMARELRKAFYINAVSMLETGQWEVSHPGKEYASVLSGGDWPGQGLGDLELTDQSFITWSRRTPASERMEVFTERSDAFKCAKALLTSFLWKRGFLRSFLIPPPRQGRISPVTHTRDHFKLTTN